MKSNYTQTPFAPNEPLSLTLSPRAGRGKWNARRVPGPRRVVVVQRCARTGLGIGLARLTETSVFLHEL